MALQYEQEQRTIDWYRDRLGCFTGSKVGVLMKKGRAKDEPFSATAKTYMYQVSGERELSPAVVQDDEMLKFYIEQTNTTSKAMRFGTEQEENARSLYADMTHHSVSEVGLCRHPSVPHFASSPDGVIKEDGNLGCVEIKCPSISTYAQYVAEVKDNDTLLRVNPDYFYQCQAHMACTEAKFCDFVVYCPFMTSPIHIVRISRDDTAIKEMEGRVALADKLITKK